MLLKLHPTMAAFGAIFQAATFPSAVPGISADIDKDIPIKNAPAPSMGVHENIIAVTSSGIISAVDINLTVTGWMNIAACGNAERRAMFDCGREFELVTEGEQASVEKLNTGGSQYHDSEGNMLQGRQCGIGMLWRCQRHLAQVV